jgi:peptidoglycan/LPS O-acetylase OafA/YrhL
MITVVSERPATARNRDLYLDALRTAAIVRVVTYHSFSLPWLSWVFPAMGMMFALAGGLMVRSLDRQPAKTVIKNRFRRLLPALWLFGAVWITLMTIHGGSPTKWTDPNTGTHMPLWHLVYWVVPIFDPPGNQWGFDGTEVLWYLRTYLWLVALSPLLLKAFRKWPIPTLLAPLAIVVLQSFNIIPNENSGDLWGLGEFWALISALGTFAPCWMLGFAHRTGKLAKLSGAATMGISLALAGAGAAWSLTHDSATYDLNGIPLGQALWSMAFILPLLRFAPADSSRIGRTPFLGRFVALVNARAVTIYLWHNVLIDLSFPIEDKLGAAVPALSSVVYNPIWNFFVIWVLIACAVLVFGWVEDVAARRSPRLFPVGPSAAQRRAADAAAAEEAAVSLDAPTVHSADQYPQYAQAAGAYRPVEVAAQDPRYPDPRYPDPRYDDPRYDDPRYGDARHNDERGYQQAQGEGGYGGGQHREEIDYRERRPGWPDERYENGYANNGYPTEQPAPYRDPRAGYPEQRRPRDERYPDQQPRHQAAKPGDGDDPPWHPPASGAGRARI